MDYKVAATAANWWEHQIKKRCKELHPAKVTGSDSDIVVIDYSLRTALSRFREEFLIYAQKESYASLTCCYFPNSTLAKLTKKAGISEEYLPIRAQMQFCGDHVEVALDDGVLCKLPLATKYL